MSNDEGSETRLGLLEQQMGKALSMLDTQRSDMSRMLKLLEVKSSKEPHSPPLSSIGEDSEGAQSPTLTEKKQRRISNSQKPAEADPGADPVWPTSPSRRPSSDGTVEEASFTKYINKLQLEVRRRAESHSRDHARPEYGLGYPSMAIRSESQRRSSAPVPADEAVTYASHALETMRDMYGGVPLPKKGASVWMFSPASPWRIGWDLAAILPILVYLTIFMPFRLAFDNQPNKFSLVWCWELTIEMVFLIDIFLHFRTGYFLLPVQRDEPMAHVPVEYDKKLVAKRYLGTWLLFDLLSGIPFILIELLLGGSDSYNELKVVKSFRLLRLLKLIRLFKVSSIMVSVDREMVDSVEDFLADKQTRSVMMSLSLSFKTLYVVHLFACFWVHVGRSGSHEGIDNWLAHEMNGPFQASDTEHGSGKEYTIYIAAHYYVMTTMSSVGYGDILSRNNTERTFSIFLELIGAFVFAIIIAALTASVTSMDMNARRANEQLESVASFVQNRKFPTSLSRRIRRHFRQYYEQKAAIDEAKIFAEMSSSLRMEVSAYIVNVQMSDVKIFQTMNPMLWSSLISILKPTRFQQGETVSRQGEECSEMYLVLHGDLIGVTFIEDEPVPRERFISPGDSINVLSVLKVWNQCVETVVCSRRPGSLIECYAVSASDFYGLFRHDEPMDRHVFREMQRVECRNYKMNLEDKLAPTRWGVPTYLTFSVVAVTVVAAKGLYGNDFMGTCDPYAVVELVNSVTLKPVDPSNRSHHHRTVTVPRSMAPAWQSQVKWRYVSQRFEQLAIKVTLFDEDTFTRDDPLGFVVLPLVDVERKVLAHATKGAPKTKWRKAHGAVKVGVTLGGGSNSSFDHAGSMRSAQGKVESDPEVGTDQEAEKGGQGERSAPPRSLHKPLKEQEKLTNTKSMLLREQEQHQQKNKSKGGFGDLEGARERFLERFQDDPEKDVRYASTLAMDKDASKEERGSVETWYNLQPHPLGPSKVSGQIRLRAWAKRSDGDHNDPTKLSASESGRNGSRPAQFSSTTPVLLGGPKRNSFMAEEQDQGGRSGGVRSPGTVAQAFGGKVWGELTAAAQKNAQQQQQEQNPTPQQELLPPLKGVSAPRHFPDDEKSEIGEEELEELEGEDTKSVV